MKQLSYRTHTTKANRNATPLAQTHGSNIIILCRELLHNKQKEKKHSLLGAAWWQDRDRVGKPTRFGQILRGRQVHQARRVKQLHESLVSASRLRRREVQVLVQH